MLEKLIKQEKLDVAAETLRALAHPLRLKILKFIDKNKAINVNKIYKTLNLEQSITSQHLGILRNSDIVITEKDGKFIYYSVNYKKIEHVMKTVKDYLEREEAEKKKSKSKS